MGTRLKNSIRNCIRFEDIGNRIQNQVIIEPLARKVGNMNWRIKAEKHSLNGKDYLSLKIAYTPSRAISSLEITIKSRLSFDLMVPEYSFYYDFNQFHLKPDVWIGDDTFLELNKYFYRRLVEGPFVVDVDIQVIAMKTSEPVHVMNLFDLTSNSLVLHSEDWRPVICAPKVLVFHHWPALAKQIPLDKSCQTEINGGIKRIFLCNFLQLLHGCRFKLNHALAYRMLHLAVVLRAQNVFRYCEQYFISSEEGVPMVHMGYYGCDRYMIHFLKKFKTLEEMKEMAGKWDDTWIDRFHPKVLKVIAQKFFSLCVDQ